jgi:single-stranded DNA-binding protein
MPYINAVQISRNPRQGTSIKKWRDKAKKTHESTDWFRVAAWGATTPSSPDPSKGRSGPVQSELRTANIRMRKKVTPPNSRARRSDHPPQSTTPNSV